jgi:hypothetical protein
MAQIFVPVKHQFTDDELRGLGGELAQAEKAAAEIRQDHERARAEFRASLRAVEKTIAELSTKINAGHELRDVEVFQIYDEPRPGWMRLVDASSNVVEEREMTPEEKQHALFEE